MIIAATGTGLLGLPMRFDMTPDYVDRQPAPGLDVARIIEPRDPVADAADDSDHDPVIHFQAWPEWEGYTFPAMPMERAMPGFFAINGKADPETETVQLRPEARVRVRFIGSISGINHPMHIHGGLFQVVEPDGCPVPVDGHWAKDTLDDAPGERDDVIREAGEPGKWLLHCQINHHTSNENVEVDGGGGLMLILAVLPSWPARWGSAWRRSRSQTGMTGTGLAESGLMPGTIAVTRPQREPHLVSAL